MSAQFVALEYFVYYLIAINLCAFLAFAVDKAMAESGGWRVPETSLLGWAMIGGTPGAYAARAAFHHKERQQPFSNQLHALACVHVILLAGTLLYLSFA